MASYKFKTVDAKSGKTTTTIVEAASEAESVAKLRARGLTPVKCLGTAKNGGETSLGGPSGKKGKFDAAEFTGQLLPLLSAHIQLERALSIIAETSENPATRDLVLDIRKGLREGEKFSTLIRNAGNLFPPLYANMIEAGEESGALTEIMEELAKFLTARKELQSFLIASMIYPAIILLVTSGVVVILFTVFIPRFAKIFTDMGKELPLPTKIMIGISSFATHPATIICWGIIIASAIFMAFKIRAGGLARERWDNFLIRIPLIGDLVKTVEMARFVRTMAVLLQTHVPILNAVTIATRVIQNKSIQNSLSAVPGSLRSGDKLSSALAASPFIAKTVIRMLSIGEETGNMGGMLAKTADLYETRLKFRIKKLLAILEPAIILVLAMVVASVVLSIFLAMLEMNNI